MKTIALNQEEESQKTKSYRDCIVILGIPIDNLTMQETLKNITFMIENFKKDGRSRHIVTVNVDFVVKTLTWALKKTKHPELLDIFRHADLVTADGMPIVWASRLLGTPLKERVTGADLVPEIASLAAKKKYSIFMMGGKAGAAKKSAKSLSLLNPNLRIAGILEPNVFSEGEKIESMEKVDKLIVDKINRGNADILLIGFGTPKQELWFNRNRYLLKVPVTIGIGGTFEFISGITNRAPDWMQKSGLEWIFRLSQDPKRLWKRYLTDVFKYGFFILPSILNYHYQKISFKLFYQSDKISNPQQHVLTSNLPTSIQIVSLGSRMDAMQIINMKKQMDGCLKNTGTLILDMREVKFIDSSGIGFLLSIWRKIERTKKQWRLVSVNKEIRLTLKLTRAWDVFKDYVQNSIEDALIDIESRKDFQPLYYHYEKHNKYNLLFIVGRLDLYETESSGILNLIDNHLDKKDWIISVKGLNFVDSSGLRVFLKFKRKLGESGNKFILTQVTYQVRQTFKISKLDKLFKITKDISSAEILLGL